MIEFLAGGGLVIAGMPLGRFLPARRRSPKPPKPVKPICGCSHHHSYHDPKTGECHSTTGGSEAVIRDTYGEPVLDRFGDVQTTSSERVPCTCRQYSGPVPLPEYVAPEISS